MLFGSNQQLGTVTSVKLKMVQMMTHSVLKSSPVQFFDLFLDRLDLDQLPNKEIIEKTGLDHGKTAKKLVQTSLNQLQHGLV